MVEHKDEVKSLCFFGGEPLLNLHGIEKFLDKLSAYYMENGFVMPVLGMVTKEEKQQIELLAQKRNWLKQDVYLAGHCIKNVSDSSINI